MDKVQRSDAAKAKSSYMASLGFAIWVKYQDLLLIACTHKSYSADHNNSIPYNERLEFLGDAILGAGITDMLYNRYPGLSESKLTLMKIYLVREETLAKVARNIHLGEHILLGHGEEQNHGRDKDAILSDTLEACIACLYLSLWRESVENFLKKYIFSLLDEEDIVPEKSAKNRLQELLQKHEQLIPTYRDDEVEVSDTGNVTLFSSTVLLRDEEIATATGKNKKRAQEAAADKAFRLLQKRYQ